MGSFNTTCFASGQTIAPGEVCQVIPIRQSATDRVVQMIVNGVEEGHFGVASHGCYPNSFWVPHGSFIEASYDDYGQFELADTSTNRLRLLCLFETLHKESLVVLQGENSVHDVTCNLREFVREKTPLIGSLIGQVNTSMVDIESEVFFNECVTLWDYVWDVSQKHRLFVTDYKKNVKPLQFAVMHETAFRNAIEVVETSPNWRGNTTTVHSYFDDIIKDFDKVTAIFGNVEDETYLFSVQYRIDMALNRMGSFEGMYYPAEEREVLPEVIKYLRKEVDAEALFEQVKPALEARLVVSGLAMMNLRFSPMVTAGQDYRNEIGSLYAQFVAKTNAVVNAARPPMDDDDEDTEVDAAST